MEGVSDRPVQRKDNIFEKGLNQENQLQWKKSQTLGVCLFVCFAGKGKGKVERKRKRGRGRGRGEREDEEQETVDLR